MVTRVLVFRVLPVALTLALSALHADDRRSRAGGGGGIGAPAGPRCRRRPRRSTITRAGTRARPVYRLGFESAVENRGDGPLIINGHRPGLENEAMDADQAGRARRSAPAGDPRSGSAPLRRLSRPPPLAPARLRSLRVAPGRPARPGGKGSQDRVSASAIATRPPGAAFRAHRPTPSTRAAVASASRSSSGSRRASRSGTATTTRRTSRASTCR